MTRRPPSSTRTYTPFPYTTLFRSYSARRRRSRPWRQAPRRSRPTPQTPSARRDAGHIPRHIRSYARPSAARRSRRPDGTSIHHEAHSTVLHSWTWTKPLEITVTRDRRFLGRFLRPRRFPCPNYPSLPSPNQIGRAHV